MRVARTVIPSTAARVRQHVAGGAAGELALQLGDALLLLAQVPEQLLELAARVVLAGRQQLDQLAQHALLATHVDERPAPVAASMRRTPAATPLSPRSLKRPMSPVRATCVPPHSSVEKSPMRTTRTRSPYLSPKNASAPALMASS